MPAVFHLAWDALEQLAGLDHAPALWGWALAAWQVHSPDFSFESLPPRKSLDGVDVLYSSSSSF